MSATGRQRATLPVPVAGDVSSSTIRQNGLKMQRVNTDKHFEPDRAGTSTCCLLVRVQPETTRAVCQCPRDSTVGAWESNPFGKKNRRSVCLDGDDQQAQSIGNSTHSTEYTPVK